METKLNTSTKVGCPLQIWKHEVQMAAIAQGADAEIIRETEVNQMVVRWYGAGEPVWMAAESLAFVAKRRAAERRAEGEADYYKRMARAYKETAESRRFGDG